MNDYHNARYKDSLDTLCINLTGNTADGILIQDKDWMYLARRFMTVYALLCNMPDWVTNPTEGLTECEMTFENFEKVYEGIATPAGCPNYTLKQLFEYIADDCKSDDIILFSDGDKQSPKVCSADTSLDFSFLDRKNNRQPMNRLYKELAKAIAKAYMSLYSRKESPQQFLSGKVEAYSPIMDCSNYQKYIHYLEVRAHFCEGFHTGVED